MRTNDHYELSNHLGNVLATISDYKSYNSTSLKYEAVVLTAQDYDPFGMALQHRAFVANEGYSRGFNGALKEDEIYGENNAYDLGARMYNVRIARQFTVDPLTNKYVWQSPYAYHRNSPISIMDFLGMGDPPTSYTSKDNFKDAKGKPLTQDFTVTTTQTQETSKIYIKPDSRAIPGPPATNIDRLNYIGWEVGSVTGAPYLFRNADNLYRHYLHGEGSDYKLNEFRNYFNDDLTGDATGIEMKNNIEKRLFEAAEILLPCPGSTNFKTNQITAGEIGSDFPYAQTEEWQKTIGGFQFQVIGKMTADEINGKILYSIYYTIHYKDYYNFDPGKIDIGTGIPDNTNYRFYQLGWADPFYSYGSFSSLKFKVK